MKTASILAGWLFVASAAWAASVGQPAPAFRAADASGKAVTLADFKGKTVVLEWVNPECPYVRKHYDSANMQATQKAATAQGVVWLSVNSTHPSHGDHKKPAEMDTARVALLRADWTRRDATISNELSRLGRNGVPVYAIYKPGQAMPTLLPELLSPQLLRDALASP